MKTASCKAKGRNFQKEICQMISSITGIEYGRDKDIDWRGMGQSGVDIILRGEVGKKLSLSIECKCQEKLNLWKAIEQAKMNQKEGTDWVLIVRRNHTEPVVIMNANKFFERINKCS